MSTGSTPFIHLAGALDAQDIDFLKSACKQHLTSEGDPCYVLIDRLAAPTVVRIKSQVERRLGQTLQYLNDFYLYTDSTFKTGWHMDTELFTFARAVNAWILLSPECVEDPVGFVAGINGGEGPMYHSVRIQGDRCSFADYCTGETREQSLAAVEASRIHTPRVRLGDILVLDPKRFHRTNVDTPKHVLAVKFILADHGAVLSDRQVDPLLWPEVALFNTLLQGARSWDEVLGGIRRALATESGRKQLRAGFYPEKFPLYQRMVVTL